MKTTVAVLVLVVVAAGTVYTQSPPTTPQIPQTAVVPTFPTPAAQPGPRKEPTLDQLLDQIERIREQKVELDRQEQVLAAEARKKIVKQTERLNRLGLGTPLPPPISNRSGGPDLAPAEPVPSPIRGAPAPPPLGR